MRSVCLFVLLGFATLTVCAQDRDALLQSGYQYLAEQEYELARQQFDLLVSVDHRDVEGRIGLGQAYYHLGDLDRAEVNFESALYRDEQEARAHFWLGRILADQKQFARAYDRLGFAWNRDTLLNGINYYLGLSAYQSGQDSVAYLHLTKAVQENVSPDYAQYYLGKVLLTYGYFEEAEAAMREALAMDDRIPRFHVGLGDVRFDQQDFASAALHYQSATRRNPEYGEAWYRLGEALLAGGQLSRANIAVKRAQNLLPPRDPDLLWLRVRLLTAQEKYARAKDLLLGHADRLNRTTESLLILGHCYAGLEDHVSAIATFKELIKRDPSNVAAFEGMASSFFHQADFASAADTYSLLMEMQPQEKRHAFNAGVSKAQAGFPQAGCALFEELSAGGDAYWADQADAAIRQFCR